jgi:colanic acid/amylovoran biosynthesis glycosyltransferase
VRAASGDGLLGDLRSRTGPRVAQVYSPFLWRHWATGWYTITALRTPTVVLTDRRQHEQEWPWPPEFLVEWDFEGEPPERLADVDVFHFHNGWTATSRGPGLMARFPEKRYVASFIGTDANRHARLDPANERKYRELLEALDAAVAPCEFMVEKLIRLGCDADKIHVIPWAVEPSILPRKEPADFSPTGTLRVCMLARMIELKGIDVAIEAVRIAAGDADVTLDVVGDGPERARLLAQADEVNRRRGAVIVTIHGDGGAMSAHEEAINVLRRSDCLVNSSRRMPDGAEETLSVAMIEAQMAGLPVLAFNCGGAADIVRQDETGRLLEFPEETTPDRLAQAMVHLATERETRVRMGAAAAERARRLFSTSVVAAAFDRLYVELAEGLTPGT